MKKINLNSLHFKNAPLVLTEIPGPNSKRFLKLQEMYEGNAVSYSRGIPVALEEARGATIRDVDGNVYIDFFGGAAVVGAGHSNPIILSKIREQENKLIHTLDLATEVREKLAEMLVKNAPGDLKGNSKVIFGGPTGSDAVEAAVKLAKYNTGKHILISFEGGYHGMSGNALALTADTFFKKKYMPMGQPVHFMPYPYCYRCPFGLEYPDCDMACIRYLEHVLEDPSSGITDVAGIIVEPIQGEGGSIVPPPKFLKEVRRISQEQQIPLIADEIQCGLGRTGKLFASEYSGVTPDIITISKALGGGVGFPLSGIIYKKNIDIWYPGAHIGTFRGFLPAMAGGIAYLEFIKRNSILKHVRNLGEFMLDALRDMEEESKIIGNARGIGLMLGAELVYNKDTKQPASDLATKFRLECLKRGLIIEIGGHYHNVARILPPLVLTKELAEKGLEIFQDAIKAVERGI